jgi:hypothetical protein
MEIVVMPLQVALHDGVQRQVVRQGAAEVAVRRLRAFAERSMLGKRPENAEK